MSFRTIVGLGVATAIILIVYNALAIIIAGIVLAAQVIFWYALGLGTLAAGYIGVMVWKQKETERLRAIDGQFALQRKRLAGGREVYIDLNRTVSGVLLVDAAAGVAELPPAAGWDIQQQHNRHVQATRSLAAITPGDTAMIRTHGAISQPRLPANITKVLPGYAKDERPAPTVAPVPALPAIPRTPASAQQMIASPGPQTTKLAIGEEVKTGEIVSWDVEQHPFARVHGATQSGKTSVARLLVAQALRHGWEVVIVDRRRGKDWGIFADHAQLVDAREPAVIVATLQAEVQRYSDRDAELGRHNAPNLTALAHITGNAYRRRLILIEELGTQHMNAKAAGRETYNAFITALRKLTAEAGATGIHGLYIDQIPDAWDKAVRYNASGSIVFHLPDYGGQVAGYPLAHQLPQYHCHYDGQIIRAGALTEDQIRQTIGRAGTLAPVRSAPIGRGLPPENAPNDRPNEPATERPALTGDEARQAIHAHLDRRPLATQAEIRKALGTSKGWTHDCWHEWHAQRSQPPAPATVGR